MNESVVMTTETTSISGTFRWMAPEMFHSDMQEDENEDEDEDEDDDEDEDEDSKLT